MRHEAIFRFEGKAMSRIFHAVEPEVEDLGRSCVDIDLADEETLVLRIHADDVSALRAALNTWLRLINVAKEMQEIV
jgi:KEOPS complex subunit Pcc1